MADAFTSQTGLWSLFHNPAGLGKIKDPEAGVFIENRFLLKELSLGAAGVALPVTSGAFGIGFHTMGFSAYRESQFSAAYAHRLGPHLRGGVQFNYQRISIPEDGYGSKGTFTADAGLQAQLSKQLWLGAVVHNLTRARLNNYQDERLPTVMSLGLGYKPSDKVLVTGDVEKNVHFPVSFRAGVDYQIVKVLHLRTGFATRPNLFAVGLGLQMGDFMLDIASQFQQLLGQTPQLSITYRPKK